MADRSFCDFVLDQLTGLGDVSARAMFGGFGLYLGPRFFGIVHDGTLYLRTGPASVGRYQAEGMGPFRPNERQTLHNYYEVPAAVLDDPSELCAWASEAAAA